MESQHSQLPKTWKTRKAGKAARAFQAEFDISDEATAALFWILDDWGKRKKIPTPPWMPWTECIDMWDMHHMEHHDNAGADWRPANLAALKRILQSIHKKIAAHYPDLCDQEMREKIMGGWNWIIKARNNLPKDDFWMIWDMSVIDRKFSDFYIKLSKYGRGINKEKFKDGVSSTVERIIKNQAR